VFVIPSEIAVSLSELTQTNKQGVEALYEAEVNLARAELALDKAEASAFIQASGPVAEKHAQAKLESAQLRFERDLAKAQVTRIRTKIRQIESELMAQATMAKIMQAEMKL
jgi:glutaredoxin 2